MKRFVAFVLCGLAALGTLFAQEGPFNKPGTIHLEFQGGPLLSLSENFFSYGENGQTLGLFSVGYGAGIVYDYNARWSVRLSVGAGGNSSASNTRETSGHMFYPYAFNSINGFVDIVADPRSKHTSMTKFLPKVYAGIGYAYTYGMHPTNENYHWFQPDDPNNALGFRFGFQGVVPLHKYIGLFFDASLEAYTDNYNGQTPRSDDFDRAAGYPGFPFDMRFPLVFGLRFNL